MPEEDKERFIIHHNGEEHPFEELFRFTVEETDVSYMVLLPVDNESVSEEDEEVEVFAFRFEETDASQVSFLPIETAEEWDLVEEMLQTFSEDGDKES